MRTLFIPTTTLNFNNIMSSESISPKAFYGNREFGYKNWHSVNENPFNNSILLYEEMPAVVRQKSDYDDYPMVIAVAVPEDIEEDMCIAGSGIRQYDRTIYLNPANTTIFFDTEEHKRIALSKSESSAETKMVSMYAKRMFCTQMVRVYDISSCKDLGLCIEAIQKDQRINKMKGFLYGYFAGAAMSMDEQTLKQLNILNEIKNIFAAILASLDGQATIEQAEMLSDLFNQLKQFDPIRIELTRLIESATLSTNEKIDRILALTLNKSGNNFNSNNFVSLIYEIKKGKPENGDNKAMSWVNQSISSLLIGAKSHKTLLNPEQEEIGLCSLSLSKVNSANVKYGKPQELFMAIVNDVLATNKFNGKISTFKQELATDITLKAREVYQEDWNESCLAKTYLNALRKHIAGEDFSQKWTSGILSSVAAVVLKGDDWEKLLEFMQTKGMADYRLAFAFYGALNGFANLTRDFSDVLLKENEAYVKSIDGFFHKQLFEYDVCAAAVPEFVEPVIETQLRDEVKNVFNSLSPTQQRANANKIEKALDLEAAQGNFEAYLFILNNLIRKNTSVYRGMDDVLHRPDSKGKNLSILVNQVLKSFTAKKDQEYCKMARKALELENKIGDPESFCYLLDDLDIKKEVRDKFFKHFGIHQEETGILSSVKKIGEQVGNLIGGLFGQDENNKINPESNKKAALESLQSSTSSTERKKVRFIPQNLELIASLIQELNPGLDDFANKQIRNDLQWVFDPKYTQWKTESDLIEIFRSVLISGKNEPISKNGKDMKWKNDAYRPLDVEKTIQALRERL